MDVVVVAEADSQAESSSSSSSLVHGDNGDDWERNAENDGSSGTGIESGGEGERERSM